MTKYFQICGEDGEDCCQTETLSTLLSDDWSSGDTEAWDGDILGSCRTSQFPECGDLEVSVNRPEGTDSLQVSNVTLQFSGDSSPMLRCGLFVGSNIFIQLIVKVSLSLLDRNRH